MKKFLYLALILLGISSPAFCQNGLVIPIKKFHFQTTPQIKFCPTNLDCHWTGIQTTDNAFVGNLTITGICVGCSGSGSDLTAVHKNSANAGTSAMTLDMSLSTTANAFKVPVVAGFTSTADGAAGYDSTNKNWHIRVNGADGIAGGFSAVPVNGNCVQANVTAGSIVLADSGDPGCNAGGAGLGFAWGGTGVDGAVTADGIASPACLGAPSSNIYTLTRDCNFTTLVINSGVSVVTNNFAIFAKISTTVNGSLNNNGSVGDTGSIFTAKNTGSSAGRYPRIIAGLISTGIGTGGGAGSPGNQAPAPSTGNQSNHSFLTTCATGPTGAAGGAGGSGAGGAGGASRAGGTGGTCINPAQVDGRNVIASFSASYTQPSSLTGQNPSLQIYGMPNGSCGQPATGSGGGGDSTTFSGASGGNSGGEGGSGGTLAIFSPAITVGASGSIQSNGGAGGAGQVGGTASGGNAGGGGGGGGGCGGPGGLLYLIYHTLSNSGTIQAIGGVGGALGGAGLGHGTGTNGATGSAGVTGPNGLVIQLPQ